MCRNARWDASYLRPTSLPLTYPVSQQAILNLDKVLEACLIVWNVGRLTIAPSRYVPREVYVSSVLHSIFFILQCQAFTRLTWDENSAVIPSSVSPGTAPPPPPSPPAAPASAIRRESDRLFDLANPEDERWQDEGPEVLV
jgi:hypothetical protein